MLFKIHKILFLTWAKGDFLFSFKRKFRFQGYCIVWISPITLTI